MKKILAILIILITIIPGSFSPAAPFKNESLRLYSYIFLLFNSNPHFVNKIEKEKISQEEMINEPDTHARYTGYMNSLADKKYKLLAGEMLELYNNRASFSEERLSGLLKKLENENIIMQFTNDRYEGYMADYILFGKKEKLKTVSPFFKDETGYYNIIPFLTYDDLTTSCTTMYKHMIFVNMNEINIDHKTFMDILSDKNSIRFFLGARINENIRCAVKKSYPRNTCTAGDVKRITEMQLLTMQIVNDKLGIYNADLVRGIGLASLLYESPYEGLIILYAYLQYDPKTVYSAASKNFVKFVSETTGNDSIADNPLMLCSMGKDELSKIAYDYYLYLIKNRKLYK